MSTAIKRELAAADAPGGEARRRLNIKSRMFVEKETVAVFQLWLMIGEQKYGHQHQQLIADLARGGGEAKGTEVAKRLIRSARAEIKRQATLEAGGK